MKINLQSLKLPVSQLNRIHEMIRVNQAGELGAVQIYKGQMFVLRNTKDQPVLQHMADQEKVHYDTFNKTISDNSIRPTIMWPVWRVAGFSLGAITAMLGREGAMACTEAVETVIGKHYNDQLRELEEFKRSSDCKETVAGLEELKSTIRKFRDEELEHLDTAVKNEAQKAPLHSVISNVIKVGCGAAIWVSERF
jgi:3-demethoxyubiquinol 3-hydroxylase